MELKIFDGDVLDSGADVIAHQTNCIGGFGSGVAGAIAHRYPTVQKEYYIHCQSHKPSDLLGTIQVCSIHDKSGKVQFIANLFGQMAYGYDGNTRYTSYDGIFDAMTKLRQWAESVSDIHVIAFPYGMSSVRGGASWNVIQEMIKAVFEDSRFEVQIWRLEPNKQ